MNISDCFHRMFRRPKVKLTHFLPGFPPRKPAPTTDYTPESALPADAAELVRLGVIRPWRTEARTGERWYTAEVGAVEWYNKYLGGRADA